MVCEGLVQNAGSPRALYLALALLCSSLVVGTTSALLAGPTEHHSSSSQSVLDSIATPAQLLQPGAIGKDHIRVAVVNTYGWCVEVEAAVLYSFTSLPQVQVHSFNDYQEPGTMRFLAKVNPTASYQVWEDFISNPLIFDLVVVVDWFPPGHMMANEKGNLLMRTLLRPEYRGKIVITLHEPRTLPWSPDDALYRNFSDIIKDDRVHIFTISPYIAAVTEGFAVAGVHKPVQWYAPVFPWRQIACRLGTAGCTTGTRRGLIVQGNIDPNKRKYASLFEGLLKKPHLIASGNLEVHLVGRGGIHIPEQLEASVKVVSGFGQEAFYDAMLDALAMLTIFPGNRYYDDAASSTVGTALIAGLPLVGTSALRHHYTYLQDADVFEVRKGESDADCIERIMSMQEADLQRHFDSVERTLNALLARNVIVFRELLDRHLHHIDSA